MADRIGKYELLSEIGRGAFGRVFRAYDPQTRRDVAIKVLIADNDPDLLARFRIEAFAAAKLQHKNIVTIFEFSEHQGEPYIVMELLEGESLQQILSRHASLSLLRKIRILYQAAEGLTCAHRTGIVHRDIKPANIMIQQNGDVKLMDFGIARVSGQTEIRRTRKGDLMGTILYMSPERLNGMDAEACSDIFSFGVVCYEFLAGKHPFEAHDYGAVIYKLTSEDPVPLRQLVEDCPETLEAIIHRSLAKDRESRYQSMEEILLDLKPVELELSQREAAAIMREVRDLIASGRPDEAQEKVRGVLQLDPANREARQLHESLIRGQRERLVRAKVDSLIEDGRSLLERRQFGPAVRSFESAVRLEDSDLALRDLLAHAKEAMEANRRAGRLLSQAHQEHLSGELDAALRYAEQALALDPRNPDAAALTAMVQQQIEQRNKGLRFEEALNHLEELLLRKDFLASRAALKQIEPDAEADLLSNLRLRISAEEAEHERRIREVRLHEGIAEARERIQSNRLEEAREILRTILREFPDSTAAGSLSQTVEQRLEAQHRAEAIDRLAREAFGLIQTERYTEARRVLEDGLKVQPSAPALQRLLDRTVALQAARERASSIERISQQVNLLRVGAKLGEALSLVDQALAELGPDVGLTDLRRRLELDLEQQQYAAGLERALTNGRALIDGGQYKEAVKALESAVLEYPGDTKLPALLSEARQAKADQEEKRFVSGVVVHTRELIEGREWQRALDAAEEAFKVYPYNTVLFELLTQTRQEWRQGKKSVALAKHCGAVEEALSAGDWNRAATVLQSARQEFPTEPALNDFEERLRQGQVEAQLRLLEEQVRLNFASGNLEGAAQQLAAHKALSGQPLWSRLERELEKLRAYKQSLQRAREFEERGDFTGAEAVLGPLLQDNPPDDQVAQSFERIHAGRKTRDREAEVARRIQNAEELIRARNVEEAAGLASQLAAEFPDHGAVAQFLQRIEAARNRAEQERAYEEVLQEAERLRLAGELGKAAELLETAPRTAPDSRAAHLLDTITAERRAVEQRRFKEGKDRVRALLGNDQFAAAAATIAELERGFPADRELASLRASAQQGLAVLEVLGGIVSLERQGAFEAALGVAEKALKDAPENSGLASAAERLRKAARENFFDKIRSFLEVNDPQSALDALHGGQVRWGVDPLWRDLLHESERSLLFEGLLRDAQRYHDQGHWEEAEQALHRALDHKSDYRATALLSELEADRIRKRKADAIQETRQQIQALLAKADLTAALEAADLLCRQFPGEAEPECERDAVLQRIEIKFVNEALTRIATLQKERQWDSALKEAEKALTTYPNNSELAAPIERLRDAAERERYRTELAEFVRRIEDRLASRNWGAVEEELQRAPEKFRGEKVLDGFRQALESGKRRQELDSFQSEILRLFASGNLEEAERHIGRRKKSLSEDPGWPSLRGELEARLAYERTLREATELRQKEKYDQAEALLRSWIARGCPDTRAAVELQAIIGERLQKSRAEMIARACQESDQLVREGRLPEALGILDRVCREFPDDDSIRERRRTLEGEAEQQRQEAQQREAERKRAAERARSIASHRLAIEAAIEGRLWDQALGKIDEAQRTFPDEKFFIDSRERAQDGKRLEALDELDRTVRARLERWDLEEAARCLAACPPDVHGHLRWRTLDEDLKRRRYYNQLLAEAEQLCICGDQEAAQSKLSEALVIGIKDTRAQSLLDDLRAGKTIPSRRLKRRTENRSRAMRVPPAARRLAIGLALLVAVTGTVLRFWPRSRSREVKPAIALTADPKEVAFSYRLGDPRPATRAVRIQPADAPFQAKAGDDWLNVTHLDGVGIELRVDVSKVNQGAYTTELQLYADGPTSNPILLIPVHLKVDGKPSVEPIPLKLNPPGPLTFDYTVGGVLPAAKPVEVVQGEIGEMTHRASFPLNLERKGKTISVSVTPQGVPPGGYDGVLVIRSSDNRVEPVEVFARLVVHPPLKPPENPLPKARTEPGPLPPPPGLEPVSPVGGTTSILPPGIKPIPIPQPPPPPAGKESDPREALVRQQITDTLEQLNLALERNRPNELKKIWPGVDKVFLESLATPRTKFSLTGPNEFQFALPYEATVICELVTNSNGRRSTQRVTLTLRNSGGAWKVQRARFESSN